MCHLINWGYASEEEILQKPFHIVMARFKWFKKRREEDLKRGQSMIDTLAKMTANYVLGGVSKTKTRFPKSHRR